MEEYTIGKDIAELQQKVWYLEQKIQNILDHLQDEEPKQEDTTR